MTAIKSITPSRESRFPDFQNHQATFLPPLRLWEIDPFFKCPVIGMCLTLAEQRQILKRLGISTKKKSAYEIHETFVANSDTENRISKRVEALLNRKYGIKKASYLDLDAEEYMVHFKTAFESGRYTELFWLATINPKLSLDMKREIFGNVHMAMHWNIEQRGATERRLVRQEKVLHDLRQSFAEKSRRLRRLQKENESLTQKCEELSKTERSMENDRCEYKPELNTVPQKVSPQTDEINQENIYLKKEMASLWTQLEKERYQKRLLQKKIRQLSEEIGSKTALNQQFKEDLSEIIDTLTALNRCEASCASFDLCRKRILIVGGITKMEKLYRQLIEGSGGIFDYHDGYMKRGSRHLESRLKRADMVLCPVSCNSHAACDMVKKLAKKHKKTIHMLANSSLSTLSQVIRETEKTEQTTSC